MKSLAFFFLIQFSSALSGLNDVMKVRISGNSYSDETAIRFLPGATPGFDSQWDAHKFFSLNPSVPQIFTRSNITDLAINALPSLLNDTTVELHMIIPVAGTYTLQGIETGAFAQGVSVKLEELSSGNMYDLRSGSIFAFTMDTASISSPVRFVVHFIVPPVITSTGFTNNDEDVTFIIQENALTIIAVTPGKYVARLYDLSGKICRNVSGSDPVTSIDISGLAAEIYIIRVETSGEVFTKKILIR